MNEESIQKKTTDIELLKRKACTIRMHLLKTIYEANSGHPGGSLSAAEIVTALYFGIMNINPSNPKWKNRDRFIMSKGHASALWYSVLAERGYFPIGELNTFRKIGSRLQGHPDMTKTPGVDMTTGSLGQGLSAGVGMALAARIRKMSYRVFVLLGDGELNEGQVWEAAMTAARYKLDNLVVVVDCNGLQLDGPTEEIMPLESLADKWRAFNWAVSEIQGNDMEEVFRALHAANSDKDSPKVIIARTVKGCGVPFMENRLKWHGKVPCQDEMNRALKHLEGGLL